MRTWQEITTEHKADLLKKRAELGAKGYSYKWIDRHLDALSVPTGVEKAYVDALRGLHGLARTHSYSTEGGVATDGYIGETWLRQMRDLMDWRNMDLGRRLDSGSLGSLGHAIAREAGFNDKELEEGF